jgi:hypothetical protein
MRTAVLLSKGRFNIPSAGKDPPLLSNNMHGAAMDRQEDDTKDVDCSRWFQPGPWF